MLTLPHAFHQRTVDLRETTKFQRVSEDEFERFARHVVGTFDGLTDNEKKALLRELLARCNLGQLKAVSNYVLPKLRLDILGQLPMELSLHIASYLDPKSLAATASVSKTYYNIVNDDLLWRNMCEKYNFQPSAVEMMEGPVNYRATFKDHFAILSNWMLGRCQSFSFTSQQSAVVTSLQFDENIVVIGLDIKGVGAINVFDSRTGEWCKTLTGHEGGVWCLQFMGKILVSGGCDRDVRVWDLESGDCRHVLHGHTSTVRCLKLKDESTVVTGSRDNTIRVWDIRLGTCLHVLRGHQGSVRNLAIKITCLSPLLTTRQLECGTPALASACTH